MIRFIFSSMLILVLSAGSFFRSEAYSLAIQHDCDIVLVDNPTPTLSDGIVEAFPLTSPELEFHRLVYLATDPSFDSRTKYQTEGWHPDLQLLARSYQGDAYKGERAYLVKI